MIRKGNIPAAKTRPLPRARKNKRPIGLAKGRFKISRKFFDPLPDPVPPMEFVVSQREAHAIATLPLSEEEALHLPKIPKLHRDPFDRMLICQAVAGGLTILTPDPLISQYPIRTLIAAANHS